MEEMHKARYWGVGWCRVSVSSQGAPPAQHFMVLEFLWRICYMGMATGD